MFCGRTSVRRSCVHCLLSVNVYFDISELSERISIKRRKYLPCEWALMNTFSRSEVKGQGHMCTNV